MNLEHIQAVWSDIDDTLLNHTSRPSEIVLRAMGHIPFKGLNTSRGISRAENAIRPTEVNLPSITLTGAEIWHQGGEMIHSFPFEVQEKQALVEQVLLNEKIVTAGFHISGTRSVAVFAPTDETLIEAERKYSSRGKIDLLTKSRSEFISIFMQASVCWLSSKWQPGTDLQFAEQLRQSFSIDAEKSYLKFRKKGVNKGSSLLWVCEYLGIDPQRVLTLGDSAETDVEAFKVTKGISVSETPLPYAIHSVRNPEELAIYLLNLFPAPESK